MREKFHDAARADSSDRWQNWAGRTDALKTRRRVQLRRATSFNVDFKCGKSLVIELRVAQSLRPAVQDETPHPRAVAETSIPYSRSGTNLKQAHYGAEEFVVGEHFLEESIMNNIIYIVGLVVVVMAILSFVGLG